RFEPPKVGHTLECLAGEFKRVYLVSACADGGWPLWALRAVSTTEDTEEHGGEALTEECAESAETTRSVYGFRTYAVRPICFHVRCEGRAIDPTRNMKRNARSLRPTRELMKALARLTAVGMTSGTSVACVSEIFLPGE